MTRVWSLLLVAALALQGCSHYHLGAGPGPGFGTIFIPPTKNKTTIAQSQATLTTLVREAFIKDGRVTVVDSASDADTTLLITLTNYRRDNAANREDDNGLARKFTLRLSATLSLRDNRSGKMLFENRTVEVQREAFVDNGLGSVPFGESNDQLQSEYNTFPLLGQLLATKATKAVLDVW
jgi:Lipopolysaccharide-assembly